MNLKLLIKRLFTKIFWILPINNRLIFFSSYEGKQFSCNPKSVYEAIIEGYSKYRFVWEYNNELLPKELDNNHTVIVKHNSLSYFIKIATSKYLITNSGISSGISLRKKQICVNTWHGGGAYKKVGAVIQENVNGTSYNEMRIIAEQTNAFISSSKEFTEVMIPSTLIPREKFLDIGMPRNDIFFNSSKYKQKQMEVKRFFNLNDNDKIVLFAPTYRGNSGNTVFSVDIPDVTTVLLGLHDRFGGDWKFLYRAHYYKTVQEKYTGIINAGSYPDMQDLLCAADVLITDYSSSIWDFSLSYKPCFLFVPDLNDYLQERGGFYTDISTWPGIIVENNNIFYNSIINFDESNYRQKIDNHHRSLGSYDNGHATEKLIEYLKIGTSDAR